MCGHTCALIIKCPLKFLLLVLMFVFILMIWVGRDIMLIILTVIACIVAGLFCFSCELVSNLEGAWCVLAVIFFPITMLIGVKNAFAEIFC